ncbi:MAG: hypothetical protein PHD81_02310 [Candidatus Nanoarchaeia archaeon]|nr:hypothetical protein [Candidatus Nanoarchaeia archaeon]MDD5587920.1 hypothetical protein [Candidatus Nanoarchaeia archaeon]
MDLYQELYLLKSHKGIAMREGFKLLNEPDEKADENYNKAQVKYLSGNGRGPKVIEFLIEESQEK